jgi:ketol-acid reductoisomerase
MASKHTSRALRSSLRQLSTPRVQQRTFTAAVSAARPAWQKTASPAFVQQTRSMKTVDFAGDKEVVYGMARDHNGKSQMF